MQTCFSRILHADIYCTEVKNVLLSLLIVVLSFFAIIGIMEFVLCIFESIAMYGNRSVCGIRIVADMRGREKNVEFLLDSLKLLSERIVFRNLTTEVHIRDCGVDTETLEQIKRYINENQNISLIENEE